MKIFESPLACQRWRASLSPQTQVGFVPTMGALHFGHLSLIEKSQRQNDITVVSIFVNPTQFGPKEDFAKYPRPWKKDLGLLKKANVKFLYAPTPNSMYTPHYTTSVVLEKLTNVLCGSPQFRGPGHFRGVATVVAKLFNAVRPHYAYFGLKDFQQVRVIEQMNQDLNFGIKIVRCPTVREKDGLAASSRNTYLSISERAIAPGLYSALQHGAKLLRSHPKMSPQAICQKVKKDLSSNPKFKIEYINLVEPVTLQEARTLRRPLLLAAAVRLGQTRLIDNILVQ